MPVKKRASKARIYRAHGHSFTELEIWKYTFLCGSDLLGDVAYFDLAPMVEHCTVDPAYAREAWGRLGEDFLAGLQPDDRDETPWALREFGDPSTCR